MTISDKMSLHNFYINFSSCTNKLNKHHYELKLQSFFSLSKLGFTWIKLIGISYGNIPRRALFSDSVYAF